LASRLLPPPLVDRLLGKHPGAVELHGWDAPLGGERHERSLIHAEIGGRFLETQHVLGVHARSSSIFFLTVSSSASRARIRSRSCSIALLTGSGGSVCSLWMTPSTRC